MLHISLITTLSPTALDLCPPLTLIPNGMITYAPDTVPDYSVGTMATYVCDEGFNLVGNMVRECLSDGTFSGIDPVCSMIRKCSHIIGSGSATIIKENPPLPYSVGVQILILNY